MDDASQNPFAPTQHPGTTRPRGARGGAAAYDFVLSATDSDGRRAAHYVQAASAAAAYASLEAQGYREITLHIDDAGAAGTRLTALEDGRVAPRDLLAMRFKTGFGFFLALVKVLAWRTRFMLILAAGFLAYRVYASGHVDVPGALAIVVLLLPVGIAAWFTIFGKQRQFDRLIDASAWGRWEEALTRIPALVGSVPQFELDAREAQALVGLGRVREGLERLRAYESGDDPPRWMYLARLADLQQLAGNYDEAVRLHEETYRLAPDNPTVELDFAMALLKNERDPQLAGRLIESAEKKPLSDLLQWMLPFIKGLLYLNTGRPREAIAAFELARSNLAPVAPAAPLLRQFLDINQAYLAIAQAKSGDRVQAIQTAAPTLARLRAIRSRRLLAALERDVGISSGASS
jgi:tetratricopeptide (TPR) repeat protein